MIADSEPVADEASDNGWIEAYVGETLFRHEMDELMEYVRANGEAVTGEWILLPCGCLAFAVEWTHSPSSHQRPMDWVEREGNAQQDGSKVATGWTNAPALYAPCCGKEMLHIFSDSDEWTCPRRAAEGGFEDGQAEAEQGETSGGVAREMLLRQHRLDCRLYHRCEIHV